MASPVTERKYDDLQPGSSLANSSLANSSVHSRSNSGSKDEEIMRLKRQVRNLSRELGNYQDNSRAIRESENPQAVHVYEQRSRCREEVRCNTCAKLWATIAVVSTVALGFLVYKLYEISEMSIWEQSIGLISANIAKSSLLERWPFSNN